MKTEFQSPEESMKNRWKLLLLALLAGSLLYLHNHYHIPLDTVLLWKPDNLLFAAAVILLLFAIKSVLVFLPIMVPQIIAGHLYPRDIALVINLAGLFLVVSIPYWIGKKRGAEKMQQFLCKYPRIQSVLNVQDDNRMAFSFMLRACAVPPADIVTMYLGASAMPFSTNVIGGVLGCFPSMVLHTLLGANIRNPGSKEFWMALMLNAAWVVLSGLSFYLFKKFHNREEAK